MSQVSMNSEDIARIRNALQVIQWNAEFLEGYTIVLREYSPGKGAEKKPEKIIEQVKRINKLLTVLKFEGGDK